MNRLHALRKAKKVTLKQLSDDTEISFSALSAYERDTRNPKIATIRTLAEYFEVSSEYLEGRKKIQNPFCIGEVIFQLRTESGISLAKLSEELNIPDATLSRYENSVREPKLEKINKILNYFGKELKVVDIDDKEENK